MFRQKHSLVNLHQSLVISFQSVTQPDFAASTSSRIVLCCVVPSSSLLLLSLHLCVSSVGGWYTGTPTSTRGGRPLMISAAFSAIMMVGAFRFPLTTLGMMDASTTLSRSTPRTRVLESTTAMGSEGEPILQVQDGW